MLMLIMERQVDPTPEEIRAACQQIQKEWSEEETDKRRTIGFVNEETVRRLSKGTKWLRALNRRRERFS